MIKSCLENNLTLFARRHQGTCSRQQWNRAWTCSVDLPSTLNFIWILILTLILYGVKLFRLIDFLVLKKECILLFAFTLKVLPEICASVLDCIHQSLLDFFLSSVSLSSLFFYMKKIKEWIFTTTDHYYLTKLLREPLLNGSLASGLLAQWLVAKVSFLASLGLFEYWGNLGCVWFHSPRPVSVIMTNLFHGCCLNCVRQHRNC